MWPTDDPNLPPPSGTTITIGNIVGMFLIALVVMGALDYCQHSGFAP